LSLHDALPIFLPCGTGVAHIFFDALCIVRLSHDTCTTFIKQRSGIPGGGTDAQHREARCDVLKKFSGKVSFCIAVAMKNKKKQRRVTIPLHQRIARYVSCEHGVPCKGRVRFDFRTECGMNLPNKFHTQICSEPLVSRYEVAQRIHKRARITAFVYNADMTNNKLCRLAVLNMLHVILIISIGDHVNVTVGKAPELSRIKWRHRYEHIGRLQYFGFEPSMDCARQRSGHQAVEQTPLTPGISEVGHPTDGREFLFQSRSDEVHAVRRTCGYDYLDSIVADESLQEFSCRPNPEPPWIRKEEVAPDPGGDGLKN